MELLIVSGLSGAGKSVAMNALVDDVHVVGVDAFCGDECEFGQILGMPATFKTPKDKDSSSQISYAHAG